MKDIDYSEDRVALDAKKLFYSYTFLLCSMVVLFIALNSFKFYIFNGNTNYSIFVLPFLFFLVDAIIKEVGYKSGVQALIISSLVLVLMNIIVDIIFGVDLSILKYVGSLFSYLLSQFINLSIYYYMLGNYSTPYFFVVLNYIFVILVYNMLYMLFVEKLVFSNSFWNIYMIIVAIQILISMICGIVLKFIRQGVD